MEIEQQTFAGVMEPRTPSQLVRDYLSAKEKESILKSDYDDAKADRVRLEKEVMEAYEKEEISGLIVDGRNIHVRPVMTASLKSPLAHEDDAFVDLLKELDMDYIVKTSINQDSLRVAIRERLESGDLKKDHAIFEHVETDEIYKIGNTKA